jgi:hypothetical protein
VVTAAAIALLVASPVDAITCCRGTVAAGPRVFVASISRGQLRETLTFHTAGQFVAHILAKQPTRLPLGGRTVALGHRAAGKTHVSFKLGDLRRGTYAVVITPGHQTTAASSHTAATWVLFAVTRAGKVTGLKLVTP